jgi:flagellar hook protein FlgE
MFDILSIATSGMMGHAKGLRTVGNNLANVNTPGFKASQLQFGALFDQGSSGQPGALHHPQGNGMETIGSRVLFKPGTEQSTGNPLDLSINGNGMFVVKHDGKLMYTRNGDFEFNGDNILVNSAGDHVQALDNQGQLVDVSLDGLNRSAPKVTKSVIFDGNLSSTPTTPVVDPSISGVTIIDANGGSHTVNLSFKDAGAGNFTVTVTASGTPATVLGTGTLTYAATAPVAGKDKIKFNYSSTGVPAFEVELDFSKTNSLATATNVNMTSQDGYVAGVRNDQSIDAEGTLNVRYSNAQTVKGARLALAEFVNADDLDQLAGGSFLLKQGGKVRYGYAGADSFGKLAAGKREGSNVDLAEEFGNLILMQRGYQASSHVISTANDMIQQLFDMKGNR